MALTGTIIWIFLVAVILIGFALITTGAAPMKRSGPLTSRALGLLRSDPIGWHLPGYGDARHVGAGLSISEYSINGEWMSPYEKRKVRQAIAIAKARQVDAKLADSVLEEEL